MHQIEQPQTTSFGPAENIHDVIKGLLREVGKEICSTTFSVFGLAAFIVCFGKVFLGVFMLDFLKVVNLAVTVLGLAVFGVGLRRGLMPLGEQVGLTLPVNAPSLVVFLVVFALGVLCTIAEPAIGALKEAGQNIDRRRAPLLSLLLDQPYVLMVIIGVGVGGAAVFGCMRLVYDLKVKTCLYGLFAPTMALTLACVSLQGAFPSVTGLAWDCGAVTTGPVTVPIVLALGIGVSSSAKPPPSQENAGDAGSDLSGFGIVTYASLLPVLSVWGLCFANGGTSIKMEDSANFMAVVRRVLEQVDVSEEDVFVKAFIGTCRAIVPLVGFLLFVQLGMVREPLANKRIMLPGLALCFIGMFIFSIGLDGALIPIGSEAGHALTNAVTRYGESMGMVVVLTFGFIAGLIATFAEPALLALGETVEKLTDGKFPKLALVFAVALGVGCGIALGMAKVYYQFSLWIILLCGYLACLALTTMNDDVVTCIAWDAAGVTTGPVTVPIVLAAGLALGDAANVAEGFGILSCASIGPIFMVLLFGIMNARRNPVASETRTGEVEVSFSNDQAARA